MRNRATVAILAVALLLSRARAGDEPDLTTELASLERPGAGEEAAVRLGARGAVEPLIAFVLERIPDAAASLADVPVPARASILRATEALARTGAPAIDPLARELARAKGTGRRGALARALGVAAARLVRADSSAAARAARALVLLLDDAPRVPAGELLLSGAVTATPDDPAGVEGLVAALGEPGAHALGDRAETLSTPAQLEPILRALGRSNGGDEATRALAHAFERATPEVRPLAGRELARRGGELAARVLARALEKGPLAERRARARELGDTRDPLLAPRALLAALARETDSAARAELLAGLARAAAPPPPKPSVPFAPDPFRPARTAEAESVRQDARRECLRRLDDPDVDVRRAAARALETLGRARDPALAQPIVEAAIPVLFRERSLGVRADLARALAVLAPAELLAFPFTVALARGLDENGGDFSARSDLVDALLGSIGREALAVPSLLRAASDETLSVATRARAAALAARATASGRAGLEPLRGGAAIERACAAAAISGLLGPGDGDDARREAEAVARDERALVRAGAGWALALGLGGAPGAQAVAPLTRDPATVVRLEAARALAELGRPAAGPLAALLADREAAVRRASVAGLLRAREPGQAGALVAALARARKRAEAAPAEAPTGEDAELERALDVVLVEGVPAIAALAARSKEPVERELAFVALGRSRTDEAVALLLPLARDPKNDARDLAALAICHATGRDLYDGMWRVLRTGN